MLLDAVPAIRAAVGELEVVVAGQGNRRLPAWCTPLGTVPDQAKAALLGSADVFVAPHRERESFGIVLLEALASGAPVVASICPPLSICSATADRASIRSATCSGSVTTRRWPAR